MLLVDIKPLIARLSRCTRETLERAIGLCFTRGHYEVGVEHVLSSLLDDRQCDAALLLRQHEVDTNRLRNDLDRALEAQRSGNSSQPAFSPLLLQLLQDAWLIGSVELGHAQLRSSAILIAFVGRTAFYLSGDVATTLKGMRKDVLLEECHTVCAASVEAVGDQDSVAPPADRAAGDSGERSAIARYCENFTEKARQGRLDPVFGRDAEIRQMVDILARRRKNNPICVGDPGVGKTAVVEGLALRIVEDDVPDVLKGVMLLGLDMGLLQAGASVKGEFENRLRRVIEEVKGSTTPVILFIDEAHTLIGAGGNAGGSDAANLLKPALARGELRTIAATTWAEYKKYFEKDAALARRFQLVRLDEPDEATAIGILRGLKETYQTAHDVTIREDAVVAAVALSRRYLTGRQLPDKAVDLLDTACARVKVLRDAKPAALERIERQMQGLEREQRSLQQDRDNQQPVDAARLDSIGEQLRTLADEAVLLHTNWLGQREAAAVLQAARTDYRTARAGGESDLAQLAQAIVDAEAAFRRAQGEKPLMRIDVDADVVATVLSDWTGIPAGNMQRDRALTVLGMADALKQRIRGQDAALEQISEIIKTGCSGLQNPQQPLGVFLLVGPSGVGKTETALSVAHELFGDEKSTVVINMSEYQEKHHVSRLIGAPPGYVGYGEGGVLTEAVRQRPYSVILLDEAEKAHPDVMNLFYQVFDKGMLSDGDGQEINFANTVIFITSNLATDIITRMASAEPPATASALLDAIRPVLSGYFKPALLARMTVVPYVTLRPDAMSGIVRLKLDSVAQRIERQMGIRLTCTEALVAQIVARCTDVDTGARNVDFIVRGTLLPRISHVLLSRMTEAIPTHAVHLDVDDNGEFSIDAQSDEPVPPFQPDQVAAA